jgi:SAM-dependent methyltransferase
VGLKRRLRAQHGFVTFGSCLPDDHARQSSARRLAASYLRGGGPEPVRVLDLGCGRGDSVAFFEALPGAIRWAGVDLEDSPEVRERTRRDERIHTFDGVNLPFESGGFDLVYSHQVLEHVRRPDELLAEVARVLRPGGAFIGSVSYLEPFHSLSIYNWTPYGLITVAGGAGLRVETLRPGSDAVTMLLRRLPGGSRLLDPLMERTTPGNFLLEAAGRLLGLDVALRNYLKIMYAGQICFIARKPE